VRAYVELSGKILDADLRLVASRVTAVGMARALSHRYIHS
jgi:hypothetical protein